MTRNSLDLSSKIDPLIAQILELIGNVAADCNIPFFIVGATARDVVFNLLHDIAPRRLTLDLDLGIQIAAWESYDKLLEKIIRTGHFIKAPLPHRLYFGKMKYPVDIMPFGAISGANGVITWPDKKQMSTRGFEEAYKESYAIKLVPTSERLIHVASPVGLVVMKLISRAESRDRAEKDAQDIELIFTNYHYLFDNEARSFDFPIILEMVHFDIVRSGTVLLGIDSAAILTAETKNVISAILSEDTNENHPSKLAIDMMKKNSSSENEYENKLQLIKDFKSGFYY